VQKIFDRFGVSADFIAKNFLGNFSAKSLNKNPVLISLKKIGKKISALNSIFFPQK
jgi:hypothetical protein